MASKCLIFCIFSGILIHNLQSQSVDNGAKSDSATNLDSLDLQSSGVTNRRNNASVSWRRRDVAHPSKDKENRRLLLKAYAEFEAEMNSKITSIIKNLHQAGDCEHGTNNGDGTCRKRPKIDTQILQEDNLIVDDSLLKDRIENIHDILMALISLATSSLETSTSSALIPYPIVRPSLNDSAQLPCSHSEGKPLRICFWERTSKGLRELIYIIDDDVIKNDGKTVLDGIAYKGDGLASGDCGLEVQKFGLDDIGRWKCILVSQDRETLTGVVTLVPSPSTIAANPQTAQPYQVVSGSVNGSANLSCEVGGEPLDLCWWEWAVQGQQEIILVNPNDGKTSAKGIITSVRGELQAGKCGLSIQNVKRKDFGAWICTLVGRNGRPFGGQVDLEDESEQGIYFGTSGQGLKYYSLTYAEVSSVPNSGTVRGVAFDMQRSKLYGYSRNNIFRHSRNGNEFESVWKADYQKYGKLEALAFDWISGNIYVASSKGFILACDGPTTLSVSCVIVWDELGEVQGLALNPITGYMYWTTFSAGNKSSIVRGEMDGVNEFRIRTDLPSPRGIAIDFASQRLYWADYHTSQIQSSDLDGTDVQLLCQLPSGSAPWGVVVVGSRTYWGTWGTKKLQSRSHSGGQIQTHYHETSRVFHLAVGPNAGLPTNRANHCEGHDCPKVCVLTATNSFSCIERTTTTIVRNRSQ